MKAVKINPELCIGCARCVRDCVSEKIRIVDGKARFMFERCIRCGHCYAICPVGAVEISGHEGYVGEKPVPMTEFNSDRLLAAMKSRRTIRHFRRDGVSDEQIEKIIEAGRYCPTGTNAQDFSFTVLKNSLADIEKEAVSFFRWAQKTATPFSSYIKNATIDDNFFFKGAPVAIIVNGKSKTNACLASSYMELMAESMGLGVLYSGFFIAASAFDRKLSHILKAEKGYKAVTCLVIGYPDVEYQRIPPREKAEVRYL